MYGMLYVNNFNFIGFASDLNLDKCLFYKGEVCKSSISYGKFRFFALSQSNSPNVLQNMKKATLKRVALFFGGPGRT